MLICQPRGRSDVGDCRLQLVVPPGHDVTVAVHHRLETLFGYVSGIVLFSLPELGVGQTCPLEEVRLRRPRHETRNRHPSVLDLGAQGE